MPGAALMDRPVPQPAGLQRRWSAQTLRWEGLRLIPLPPNSWPVKPQTKLFKPSHNTAQNRAGFPDKHHSRRNDFRQPSKLINHRTNTRHKVILAILAQVRSIVRRDSGAILFSKNLDLVARVETIGTEKNCTRPTCTLTRLLAQGETSFRSHARNAPRILN